MCILSRHGINPLNRSICMFIFERTTVISVQYTPYKRQQKKGTYPNIVFMMTGSSQQKKKKKRKGKPFQGNEKNVFKAAVQAS